MPAQLTENQKAWVAELRSGNRKQVRSYLKKELPDSESPGFCCLGVACELVGLESDRPVHDIVYMFRAARRDGRTAEHTVYPPKIVLEWLGANTNDNDAVLLDVPQAIRELPQQGHEPGPDRHYFGDDLLVAAQMHGRIHELTAARLNDQGFTFNQIADLVEYFGLVPA